MAQKRSRLEYSSVIDPAATLPRAEKARVLVRATARPKADVEKALSAAPQASLLDLKRTVDAAAPGKRVKVPKLSGAAGPIGSSYVKANPAARAAGLSRMLLEAEARSKAQVKFEAKISTEPPAKKRRTGSWACAACLDDGLPSSKVVVCPMLVKYNKGMLGSVFGGPQQHVYCCSCLRSYLLGSRLHQGDLNKMLCPGCEHRARTGVSVSKESLGKKYHDYKGSKAIDKLPQSDVSRVVGPVDELRMHDLRMRSGRKVAVPPAVKKALRGCGAKACPYCGSYSEQKGGCAAVICPNCTRIFDWKRAKA